MRQFDEEAWPILRQAHDAAEAAGDSELAVWITLSQIACGDKSALPRAEEVMLDNPDPSVRYAAASYYAYLAGNEGKEALRKALDDPAVSENMLHPTDGGKLPFVALMAAEGLRKLGEEAPSLDELREKFGIEVPAR
jgi:HEAT repeat protein